MIDYRLLAEAQHFYEDMGYQYVETPWLVTSEISNITKPPNAASYIVQRKGETLNKEFVASGEQSFLYLINKGFLPDGKYQTITPCMRNDPFDETHTKYFMKLELINFSTHGKVSSITYETIQRDAMTFFMSEVGDACKLSIEYPENIPDCSDITFDGIEIGSYGIRNCSYCSWAYGTGLAEPRFSRTIRKGRFAV